MLQEPYIGALRRENSKTGRKQLTKFNQGIKVASFLDTVLTISWTHILFKVIIST
jgi:hypothetical protein